MVIHFRNLKINSPALRTGFPEINLWRKALGTAVNLIEYLLPQPPLRRRDHEEETKHHPDLPQKSAQRSDNGNLHSGKPAQSPAFAFGEAAEIHRFLQAEPSGTRQRNPEHCFLFPIRSATGTTLSAPENAALHIESLLPLSGPHLSAEPKKSRSRWKKLAGTEKVDLKNRTGY